MPYLAKSDLVDVFRGLCFWGIPYLEILEISVKEYSSQRTHIMLALRLINTDIVGSLGKMLWSLDRHLRILLEFWLVAGHWRLIDRSLHYPGPLDSKSE